MHNARLEPCASAWCTLQVLALALVTLCCGTRCCCAHVGRDKVARRRRRHLRESGVEAYQLGSSLTETFVRDRGSVPTWGFIVVCNVLVRLSLAGDRVSGGDLVSVGVTLCFT